MAGLYSGAEELAFTPVAGGFVFQTSNPWCFGPRRRYFVTEAQKPIIAACIRETLKRLVPAVIVAAILIPLVIIGGTLWLAFQGARLDVTMKSATGSTTSYAQAIDANGAAVTLDGLAGAKVVCRVTGFPGEGATMTTTWFDANGKAGASSSSPFRPSGMAVNLNDANHRTISSAVLVGRIGATSSATLLYAGLLTLATFGPYFALLQLYSLSRLRPLLADLPRTRLRVPLRAKSQVFASKVPFKLLVVIGAASAVSSVANGALIVNAMLEHHPIVDQPAPYIGLAFSSLVMARMSYIAILRARLHRKAIATGSRLA